MRRSSLNELLAPILETAPIIHPDSEVEVLRELPVETLYLALKDADAETSLWFFQNALPEQVQGLLDIDCWQGADFLPERYEEYFKTMALLSPPNIAEYMKNLDPEIIVRGLIELCEVLDYDPQNPPELQDENFMLTMDNKYLLVFKKDDPNLKEATFQWINKFSAADIELLRRHLESTKWEVASDLEEFAYRIKKGRLEEMGFVDYFDAIELYSRGQASTLKKELLDSPLDDGVKFPPELVVGEDDSDIASPSLLPKVIAGSVWERGFIRDCLAKIETHQKKQILLQELLRTVNASLSADKVIHEGLAEIEQASLRARAYLELGLLYLAEGDPERGAGLMRRQPLAQIYRLGWLTVHDLSRAAVELKNSFGSAIFGEIDQRLIEDLIGKRHPTFDAAYLKDLDITSGFPSFDGVLKVGLRLADLSILGRFAWDELENALKFKTEPLLTEGDSIYTRLLTLLFRQAAGSEAESRALSIEEWTQLSAKIDWAKLDRALELISQKVPERARTLFKKRLQTQISDTKFYIDNNPLGKIPDPRFFKSLNFAKAKN